MKLFLIITSLLSVAVAQQIRCRYVNYGSVYGCELTITNTNGFNSFTAIEGAHLSGYNNARVGVLYRVSGVTTNVPRIICDTFTNLQSMDLHNTGMTTVDDNAFRGCTQLTQLDLWENSINSISANAFATIRNIQFLNLEQNRLTSLPANQFANNNNLQFLYLSRNLFTSFPVGIFRPLSSLLHLGLGYCNLTEINNQWFGTNNTRLVDLHVGSNRISLTANSFVGLESLVYLNIGNNVISQVPAGAFAPLRNLRDLDIFGNPFTQLAADTFAGLTNLEYLQTGYAPIQQIQVGAFRGLGNLKTLILSNCLLNQIPTAAFEELRSLNYIDLSYNSIEDLGTYLTPLQNLREVTLRYNNLRTIRRSNFGIVTSLNTLDLDVNSVNAFDRALLDAAVNFESLFFSLNQCVSGYFISFSTSRAQYLVSLAPCFSNFAGELD